MGQEMLMFSKWEARVSAKVANASADQIWPLVKDFFGIHKYFPNLQISYGIEGKNGEIGSIRYCESCDLVKSSDDDDDDDGKKQPLVNWAKERIIGIDPNEKSLTYELIDSNIGFNSYVSTMKVATMNNCAKISDDESVGCVLEWSFSVDPVEGFKFEDLVTQYRLWLQKMAQNMKDLSQ
ncbi:OLC1v1029099C1 [Oldenlandia corymbosa var. corymbosa]|uniref:OLC1v1029099C1 n=1 Tax=Oldenlandia corymbosa var. corymbosa TaxID=529605 RepID=A0AAV1CFZ0_OLDCO|nr:OLC1v1029099C1 [Oldenlandia corymbosa var. corymbosa]